MLMTFGTVQKIQVLNDKLEFCAAGFRRIFLNLVPRVSGLGDRTWRSESLLAWTNSAGRISSRTSETSILLAD